MTSITALFDYAWAQTLAWALLHFVWQGALLGLVAFAGVRLFRLSASTRYAVGVLTLVAMLAAPIITFTALYRPSNPVAIVNTAGPATATPDRSVALPAGSAAVPAVGPAVDYGGPAALSHDRFAKVFLSIWLIGVSLLSVRLLGGWVVAGRLTRRATRPARPELQSLAQRLAGRLALERVVHVVESSAVTVPMLVGWIKPVVLLPASALSGLPLAQVEALIAHELAHVRRHDYLVNLLQSVVETLLFYHPAVFWVSRQVRREREHCCDDLAVAVCDRVDYVTALASLAAMTATPQMALAATDGSLVGRVQRLLSGRNDEQVAGASAWVSASALVVAVLFAAAAVPAALASPDVTGQKPVVAEAGQAGSSIAPVVAQADTPAAILSWSPTADSQQPPPPPPPPPPPAPVPPVPPVPAPAAVPPPAVPDAPPPAPVADVVLPAPIRPPVPPVGLADQSPERTGEQLQAEREYQAAQREIEVQRLELELQRAKVAAQARMEAAAAQMELLKKQLEKTKQMVAEGLARSEQQTELEVRLVAMAQQLKAAEAELTLQQADIELRRREAVARSEFERQLSARDADRMREHARQMEREVAAIRERALGESREARASAEAIRALEEQARAMVVRLRSGEVLAPAEPDARLRPSDVVGLRIADEPDLPRTYTVAEDGTIRLPLIGTIKVEGLTADEVRDAVVGELTTRKLKATPSVKVTLFYVVR